jgi:CubicO group peptidase (beta-lactamase class C family)
MQPRTIVAATIVFLVCLALVGVALRWNPSTEPRYDFTRLDRALEQMVAENNLPGASMVILRGEERIYETSLGTFDIDSWVTTGSASKWASAAAILTLVDDGTLSMDTTIGSKVPSWNEGPIAGVTLEMALSHRAGMHAKHDCLRAYDKPLLECVDKIAQRPLLYAPGEGFGYGALSFHAAAGLAEAATGQPFRTVFQERLADPLGMTQTRFGRGGQSPNPGVAGNLVTSSNDFANFLQMVLNYGMFNGKRILTEERIRDMEGPHAGPGPYFHHIPDRHAGSRHDIYGLGVWRDVVAPDGQLLVMSSPGKFGFTPWIDRRVNVAAVITAEWSHKQLRVGKPPDPADVMYLVCDIVHRADHPDAPTPNPYCRRRGVAEAFGEEPPE